MPESRVFRPRTEKEDKLIDLAMDVRAKDRTIAKPSWTQYVEYLLNKDIMEIRQRHQNRATGG